MCALRTKQLSFIKQLLYVKHSTSNFMYFKSYNPHSYWEALFSTLYIRAQKDYLSHLKVIQLEKKKAFEPKLL
jgi:hypothetical protein